MAQIQTSGLDNFNRVMSGGILLIVVGGGAYWTNSNWNEIVTEHDSFRERVNLNNNFNEVLPFRLGSGGQNRGRQFEPPSVQQLHDATNFRPDYDPNRSILDQPNLYRDRQ